MTHDMSVKDPYLVRCNLENRERKEKGKGKEKEKEKRKKHAWVACNVVHTGHVGDAPSKPNGGEERTIFQSSGVRLLACTKLEDVQPVG